MIPEPIKLIHFKLIWFDATFAGTCNMYNKTIGNILTSVLLLDEELRDEELLDEELLDEELLDKDDDAPVGAP